MIRVTYYYSACVRIETKELSVLCDPWFSEGAYDGSWYHYPPVREPMRMVGACDFVYVSHIHPDHYDASFLRNYQETHPKAQVIIAKRNRNYLSDKMRADGIAHQTIERLELGSTSLAIVPTGEASNDVDSALVVKRESHSVVNMNDNMLNAEHVERILAFVGGRPSIALLGYTGAGAYPQTYFRDPRVLVVKADEKKAVFFQRYLAMRDALNPRLTIPFAGKYLLGGHLHELNRDRGVADACEILRIDSQAVVLADGGQASIDTKTLKPTAIRTEPYDERAMEQYAASLADRPMQYHRYFGNVPQSALPTQRLLPKAYANAHKHSQVERDYFFCTRIGARWFVCNANRSTFDCQYRDEVTSLFPRSELEVDPHYLFGLVTCVFHWNNAEIGSQYRTSRFPNEHDRDVQAFLNFFHV